ncbi:MAG: glucans biosynthesis protein MdoG, partial [Hafnia sp.]
MLTHLLITRPKVRALTGLAASVFLMLATTQAWAFSLDDVAKKAQSLAGESFKAPKSNLPSEFREMKFA